MQRSRSLPVIVHCAHHGRAVRATRNLVTDRLASCEEAEKCRRPIVPGDTQEAARTFPPGCAVYPSLALAK
jgi:hypothetical protein